MWAAKPERRETMNRQKQVTLIVEGEVIQARVRVRDRKERGERKDERREVIRTMREDRQYA